MEILFIVPYVPNPIRVRPYELLRTLAARGHRITLATLWQEQSEYDDLAMLRAWGIEVIAQHLGAWRTLWNCAQSVPVRTPLQAAYAWQPTLAHQLTQLVQQRHFDVIHVEHLRGARYGLHLKRLLDQAATGNHAQPIPVVWDSVDCISHLFTQAAARSRSLRGRLMTKLELGPTKRYEGWLLHQFDRVLVTSKADQVALSGLAQRNNGGTAKAAVCPTIIPNGVDLARFDQGVGARTPATVVFSGKMSYHANITAALHLIQEIMPVVWQNNPTVKVQIVGKDPPPAIRNLATTTAQADGDGYRVVEVTGTVPALQPYLQQATVAIAPLLYGAGIQNKVLEAMACGAPVITSSQAAAGMQAQVGAELLVADGAEAFATAITALLADPTLCQQLGQAGRAYVERVHAWPQIVAQLETIYTEAAPVTHK